MKEKATDNRASHLTPNVTRNGACCTARPQRVRKRKISKAAIGIAIAAPSIAPTEPPTSAVPRNMPPRRLPYATPMRVPASANQRKTRTRRLVARRIGPQSTVFCEPAHVRSLRHDRDRALHERGVLVTAARLQEVLHLGGELVDRPVPGQHSAHGDAPADPGPRRLGEPS